MAVKSQDVGAIIDWTVAGEFVDFAGERYYAIRNVDAMEPFFISLISSDDHWLFISSTGGLTAGRVSPETALFPYVTVDKIHDCAANTGSRTIFHVESGGNSNSWEPFNRAHDGRYTVSRHLLKSVLGDKLCFEEVNHDLAMAFRYTWSSSARYGFVRHCELSNLADHSVTVELVDGVQNILPAGTPLFAQTNSSNLVDAYKWAELDAATGLAVYTLYSGITDRAEPCESLRANTVFCLGLDAPAVLISARQVDDFRRRLPLQQELQRRGIRGAYLVNHTLELAANASRQWDIVANIEQSQAQVVELQMQLEERSAVAESITRSIDRGTDKLARIMASADGFQATAEETVAVHHYANVMFNVLRGGIFDRHYTVTSRDFLATVKHFNGNVFERNQALLRALPDNLDFASLLTTVRRHGDPQLVRLCQEYLPITFGRRHGDPSRPWNQFAIRLKDDSGNPLLSYQGNWRDIFQNWEALAFSYPEFVENVIAKFVNASTMDGYNPYRITKEGIDWEVEEPDDPWSFIGYWGDHQIIYLQKLLELSRQFHPTRLGELLREPVFSYANVPYRIKSFEAMLKDPKSTVVYDDQLATLIEQRVEQIGADGKLVAAPDGEVYQVNLLEKLLVPLLAKLSNLVVDGGIWMNTQRPEWNDANNALVGQGLSMVTLYYMRRYIRFLLQALELEDGSVELSKQVLQWHVDTAAALERIRPLLGHGPISAKERYQALLELGQAACRYRQVIYEQESISAKDSHPIARIRAMLDNALAAVDHSIANNQRSDNLYHAYNVLDVKQDALNIERLYPMLEGQVAALSAGAISPEDAVGVLEALFDSEVYYPAQDSFFLYPDRELPSFLNKNRIPADKIRAVPLLQRMVAGGDERILLQDPQGCYRFNADLSNARDLDAQLNALESEYGTEIDAARENLRELFETVFNHKAFTGRSGGMFGFEGLGCIYWHMVSKLLLAVNENFFAALEQGADQHTRQRLGELYYRVRQGLGFNKTPIEYGAFPTEPYSHTPRHAGARQPGMTGQVKEELLARYGELGVRVRDGVVRFEPGLLRSREFLNQARLFRFLDVTDRWLELSVPAQGLAFTWCQMPIVYQLADSADVAVEVIWQDGRNQSLPEPELPSEICAELFGRTGAIRQINVNLHSSMLFAP